MNHSVRKILARLSMVAVFISAWSLVSGHPPWTVGFWKWTGGYSKPLAIVTAIVLVGYIGAFVFLMLHPRRHRSPDDAMAIGCMTAVCLAIGGILALFGLAIHFELNFLVKWIMAGTLMTAVPVIAQFAWLGVGKLKKRNADRQTWIRQEQIAERLSGRTHVIQRHTGENPTRAWRELRFYSPDGRMPGFKEEGGRIEAYPAKVTWRAERGFLVTTSPEHLDKPREYTLMSRKDGTISYYLHDESSPHNGELLFRTMEIREGEPVATADPPASEVAAPATAAPVT